jgi:hypothetical protein
MQAPLALHLHADKKESNLDGHLAKVYTSMSSVNFIDSCYEYEAIDPKSRGRDK